MELKRKSGDSSEEETAVFSQISLFKKSFEKLINNLDYETLHLTKFEIQFKSSVLFVQCGLYK